MTQPIVLLFDIDGTLLLSGGAGKRAVSRAFGEVLGAPGVLDDHDFRGMTDRALFRAGIDATGTPYHDELLAKLLERYLHHLARELPEAQNFRVLPGVPELLTTLGGRDHVALGLGTGNVEQGARLKLNRGGLANHFTFGGYGDDAEDRVRLVQSGSARGAARLGHAPSACQVVVIGDSLRDVEASRGIGARCIAVTTGGHTADELLTAGADAVFETLADPAVVPHLLASGSRIAGWRE